MYKGKKYSLQYIKKLMKKIAKENGIPDQARHTLRHSKVVFSFAQKIASKATKNGYKIDREFIKIACHLHDIGRVVTGHKKTVLLKEAKYHGIEGYRILKKYRYPEKFARVCLVHIAGTGYDKATNRKFGIFKNRETLAKTPEEIIIAYADSRTGFDKKKKVPVILPFKYPRVRFGKYKGLKKRLLKNHEFIKKITNNEIT